MLRTMDTSDVSRATTQATHWQQYLRTSNTYDLSGDDKLLAENKMCELFDRFCYLLGDNKWHVNH